MTGFRGMEHLEEDTPFFRFQTALKANIENYGPESDFLKHTVTVLNSLNSEIVSYTDMFLGRSLLKCICQNYCNLLSISACDIRIKEYKYTLSAL